MRLLLLRHAIAHDSPPPGEVGDAARRLTEAGRAKMEVAARGLRALVPDLALIATSPLVRARETAEILAAAYGDVPLVECSPLEPGAGRRATLAWLGDHDEPTIALVGHQPDMGRLASYLLAGAGNFISFRKGGAACLDFEGTARAGAGTLRWLLEPGAARALGHTPE